MSELRQGKIEFLTRNEFMTARSEDLTKFLSTHPAMCQGLLALLSKMKPLPEKGGKA